MKLKEIYENFVEIGKDNDPRGREGVESYLEEQKKKYEELPEEEKEFFDKERLTNPYTDTRILNGDPETDVRSVLMGIDIGVGELLLADKLSESGTRIDAVISHHPCGGSADRISDVMWLQADSLRNAGIPINVAEGILAPRIKEVERRMWAANHNRVRDAARLLDVPLICVHTAADNCVSGYLTKRFDEKKPQRLKDVVKLLEGEQEYRQAKMDGNGPQIWVGEENRRAGGIMVDMTGGTAGSDDVFEKLEGSSDIGTIVGMHMGEEHRKKAKEHHINVVIAGHMSSDSMGINLLFDEMGKKGGVLEIFETSGFRRFSRA